MPVQFRYLFNLLSLSVLSLTSYSQKQFHATIVFDSSIDTRNILLQYYNGKNTIDITDTFVNHTIIVKGNFFSEKLPLTILQKENQQTTHQETIFLTTQPAHIHIRKSEAHSTPIWAYPKLVNAQPVLDTNYNPLYKGLLEFRKAEATAVAELWEKNGDKVMTNDSLDKLHTKLFKALNRRITLYLKAHAQDYFSFWYFKEQIISPAISFIRKDSRYFNELTADFKNTFPARFTQSIEGENLLKELSLYTNPPLKEGDTIPAFAIKGINGALVNSRSHKSRFMLIDFWQTWCGPCLQEIPLIIELKEKYSSDTLEVVSITTEPNYEKMTSFIKKYKMDWIHIWDQDNQLRFLLTVNTYPTKILIDNKGIIRYLKLGSGYAEALSQIIGN